MARPAARAAGRRGPTQCWVRAARAQLSNPDLCEASQNGLVCDWPQRHRTIASPGGSSKTPPSGSMTRTGPVTLYGPLSRTLISTIGGASAIVARRHDLLEALDGLGSLLAQLADVPAGERHEQHRRGRGHRCVALGTLEHAHLAHDVAGAQLGHRL